MNQFRCFKNSHGSICYQDTPWNDRVLKGKSLDITSVDAPSDTAQILLADFCSMMTDHAYTLAAMRVPASSMILRKALINNGFYVVEHVLHVSSHGMDHQKLDALTERFPVTVVDFCPDDLKDVQEMAAFEFNNGRFFEDPFIDTGTSRLRNTYWIDDLLKQNAVVKLLKKNRINAGFMAYTVRNSVADLILGGVRDTFRHLSYGFWAHILLSLKGVEEIQTLISSSNVNILNLYACLGFTFKTPMFGYHKHL